MRVRVDEARSDGGAAGIELRLTVRAEVGSDFDDHTIAHPHVGAAHRCAGSVDNGAAAHQ